VRTTLLSILLALTLAAPASARDDDVRVEGSCGAGAESLLRLRADDGSIRVEFRVDSRRSGERWRVALVHERRVVWRGRVRTRSGGSFRVRRSVPDYDGADEVSVRASGPGGNTCQAEATLRES
jgi:hypothetical protein